MSFSGKKYRRVRGENVLELAKAAKLSGDIRSVVSAPAPTVCFERRGHASFVCSLLLDGRRRAFSFTLGQETPMKRRDGAKVLVTYFLEGDSVLKQVVKQPDGRVAYFEKVFSDKEMVMSIRIEGAPAQALVYHERVD